MPSSQAKKTTIIGVVGAGTMGAGIAETAALAGLIVLLHDAAPSALAAGLGRIKTSLRTAVEKGRRSSTEATEALAHIHTCRHLNDLSEASLIIEAAVEELGVKQEIFRKLDAIVRPDSVLATNTSSLSVTSIASATRMPESVVGMHFFNPAPVMKLVEVVRGSHTSEQTVKHACEAAIAMGKTPVACRDTPGFIVNRIARSFYGEALRLLSEQVAPVEEIDRIVKREAGFRMGPFELMDLIGIDVNYAATVAIYEQFFHEPRFRPHPIQRQMVEAGTLGRKTGKGFYTYAK